MENYIGSQQHFEDSINADYDERDRRNKEQEDTREQPDNRQQCYKTGEECKHNCQGLCKESV